MDYIVTLFAIIKKCFSYGEGESESHWIVSNTLWPYDLYSPWNSPGQNTGVGSLSLLQGIFPTQGSTPGLLHCRRIFYQVSHQGSPRIRDRVAYSFSSKSSRPRNQTGVSCTAGGFVKNSLPAELPGNRHETRQSQMKKYNNHSTKTWHKVEWQQMFWTNNLSCHLLQETTHSDKKEFKLFWS